MWISVKERLPGKDVGVVNAYVATDAPHITMLRWDGIYWFTYDGNILRSPVSHWWDGPLPDPPKEG